MNDTFQSGKHCSDHETLVAYLYDECDRADRDAVAAHLAQCAACAEEVASLRATRTQLAAWAPPDARLGFQITSAAQRNEPLAFASPPSRRQWWREPLPAWAQAAAAALIFAAGLAAGSIGGDSRGRDTVASAPAVTPVSTARVVATTPAAPSVTAADLARLEQRLRAIETRTSRIASPQLVAAAPSGGVDERQMLARVEALVNARIAERDARLQTNLLTLADAADAQYRQLEEKVVRAQGVTADDLRQVRGAMNPFVTPVSFRPAGQR